MFFYPDLGWTVQTIVKVLFVAFLAISNIIGVRAAGKTNDVLTVIKLTPLVFFVGAGLIYMLLHPIGTISNFSPFFPYGAGNFGAALVLIFWAYAGFEISTIPADEIREPGKTIPRAIVLGISIVTVFYLTTNFVLFGVRPWSQLASDVAPLASATTTMLSANATLMLIGAAIVGVGALFSVAGSDESGMIGTSRLAYALAVDGLFPRIFAKIHPKFKTPYLAVLAQAVTALIASIVGNLSMLIASSVFFMAVAYPATSASVFSLKKSMKPKYHLRGGLAVPSLGIIFSLFLISQCTIVQIAIGLALLAIGVPIYVKYSPKKEMTELKEVLLSRDSTLRRAYRQEGRFLAHALGYLERRITHQKEKWVKINSNEEQLN